MTPFFHGMLHASSAGWSNSAKPLRPFSFALDISASGALIPKDAEHFTFRQSDYQYLRISSGSSEIPTVLGGDAHTRLEIVIPINGGTEQKVMEFDAASGISTNLPMNLVPMPKLQLSMGLPLGTEVSLRYVPNISAANQGYVGLFGLGVKHSISQYFPKAKDENGKKKKQHFNLSVQASYENMSAGTLNTSNDKNVELSMSAINLQGLASFDYKFLTLYSGVGYTKGSSTFKVKGTYDYSYDVQDSNGVHLRTETVQIVDPLTLEFNPSGYRATVGARLNLFFLKIFADYTFQKYSVVNFGVGFKI